MNIADKTVYFTIGASLLLFAWTMVRAWRVFHAPKLAPPPAGQHFVSLRLVSGANKPWHIQVKHIVGAAVLVACALFVVYAPPSSCKQTFPPFVDAFWWVAIFLPSAIFVIPAFNVIMLPQMAWHFHHGYDKNPHKTVMLKRLPTSERTWPFDSLPFHPTRAYYHPKAMKYFAVTVALLLVAFEVYWLSSFVRVFVYLFGNVDSFAELNQIFVTACAKESP